MSQSRLQSTLPATLLLFAATFVLHAQPVTQSDPLRQLIDADKGLLEASAGVHPNFENYQEGLAPDYIDIEFGSVHSREEVLAQVKKLKDFSYQYENPHAILITPTSGYVISEVSYSGIINGAGIKNRVLATTIFSLEHGRWVAHLQMSEPLERPAATAVVPDNDPTLVGLRALAAQVCAKVHVPGYSAFTPPKVMLDAGASGSYFVYSENTVHSAQFADLPEPMQGIWTQWAGYTTDQPDGKALFDDMFHRFFFVHELGHWMAFQVIARLPEKEMRLISENEANNMWAREIAANRIAVAWYREHDPQYLARLVADFRQIQARLPNPVPAGLDKKTYFTNNYRKLGTDPQAYGWYQLQMVILVYDEPAATFEQVLNKLPANRYE